MKQLFLFSSAIFILGSCEKCAECHYDKGEAEIEIGEYCEDDLETIENTGYYESSTDSTYTVHCSDH